MQSSRYIAWEIQERVKSKLEEYTGYEVKGVNIAVQGIDFEKIYKLIS